MNEIIKEPASEDRIVDAADTVFHQKGAMPLPLNDVASLAGVSRSLIYAHYPSQHELINAVVRRHMRQLNVSELMLFSHNEHLTVILDQVCEGLFRHFVEHGTILFQATQDDFMLDDIEPVLVKESRRSLLRLSRIVRRSLDLSPRSALATVLIFAAIPEESAKLVRSGSVTFDTGLSMLHRIVHLSVSALEKR